MQFDIGSLLSVLVGGLLVFAAQWFASRQSAKTEAQKWKQEERREGRRDIVRFRQERARPIIEALDRATRRWDAESYLELAGLVGYEGEKVEHSEYYKEKLKERRKKHMNQLMDDISAATTIHDEKTRRVVMEVLWQSTEPEADNKYQERLREAYLQLENWIFNPQQSSTPAFSEHRQKDSNAETNGIKLANPVLLGTLYFSFALALWSSGQLASKPVVGIAIFSSLVSIAFFVAVFLKSVLNVLSKWVVRPLVLASFFAFVYGFVIEWLQPLPQVSGIPLKVVLYLGFAWIVAFLLVIIRDTKQPSRIRNRVFLFIHGSGPYIVVLAFLIFAVMKFLNHDFWSGGYAIAIAGLSLSVARGWLPVFGDVFQ